MNWTDYEAVWKRQEPPIGAAADLAHIHATFEVKRRKLAATLLVRNLTEGVLGVLTALGLIGYACWLGKAGWPIALGAALIFGVSWVFVRDLLRRRRQRLGPEATLLTKLDSEISELHHQRRLLRRIGLWYFLPFLAALALIVTAVVHHLRIKLPSELLIALLTTPRSAIFIYLMAITAAGLWWTWRHAQDAEKKRIDPRIQELEKMRCDLLDPGCNPSR